MKKILFIIILSIVIASCSKSKNELHEQVTAYYKGYENADYNQVKNTIADTLTIVAGDYTTKYTPKSYYNLFQWDSVFKPNYQLVELKKQGEQIIATVSVHSLRYDFLKNNPLNYKHKLYFKSGKITKIEDVDFIDVNWQIWQNERDKLVNWVQENNPELDGFINDLSKKGAINYVKAIELYQKHHAK